MIAPATLARAFGYSQGTKNEHIATGSYTFEDSNLDCFHIYDYKQTTEYWGMPRDNAYYDNKANYSRPIHRRKHRYPTPEVFWKMEEPKLFKIQYSMHSDIKSFKRKLKKYLAEIEANPDYDFDKICSEKYKHEIDICTGDFNEQGVVNHSDIAAFKYDWTYHLTDKELKELKKRPYRPIPPDPIDFTKAERHYVKKTDLKDLELDRTNLIKK
jgi:hypothetical protein